MRKIISLKYNFQAIAVGEEKFYDEIRERVAPAAYSFMRRYKMKFKVSKVTEPSRGTICKRIA